MLDQLFDEFAGLPLHVLVIHLAVVLVPATVLLAVLFAAVQRWRWLLRWPLGLAAVGSLAVVALAVVSGKAFVAMQPGLGELVAAHEEAGELLLVLMVVFTVVALVAVSTLGGPTALASGRGARRGVPRAADRGIGAVLVVAAAVCLYQVIRTGDLGARAVWGG